MKTVVEKIKVVVGMIGLINRLSSVKGTTFVGMTATTEPKMNKGGRGGVPVNRLYGNVIKDSIVGGIIGANYQNMVNNARAKQAKSDIESIVFSFDDDVRESMLLFGVTEQEISDFEAKMTADIQTKALSTFDIPDFVAGERGWGNHLEIGKDDKGEPIYSKIIIEHKKDGEHRYYVQLFVLSAKKPTYRYADSGQEISDTDLDYIKQYFPKKDEGENQGLRNPIIVRDYRFDNVKTITVNKTEYEIS